MLIDIILGEDIDSLEFYKLRKKEIIDSTRKLCKVFNDTNEHFNINNLPLVVEYSASDFTKPIKEKLSSSFT